MDITWFYMKLPSMLFYELYRVILIGKYISEDSWVIYYDDETWNTAYEMDSINTDDCNWGWYPVIYDSSEV